jgi:hypothetical protein
MKFPRYSFLLTLFSALVLTSTFQPVSEFTPRVTAQQKNGQFLLQSTSGLSPFLEID